MRGRDQAVNPGPLDRLRSRSGPQLPVHRLGMGLDRVEGDEHCGRDFVLGQVTGKETEKLALPVGQRLEYFDGCVGGARRQSAEAENEFLEIRVRSAFLACKQGRGHLRCVIEKHPDETSGPAQVDGPDKRDFGPRLVAELVIGPGQQEVPLDVHPGPDGGNRVGGQTPAGPVRASRSQIDTSQ